MTITPSIQGIAAPVPSCQNENEPNPDRFSGLLPGGGWLKVAATPLEPEL
jgi:hypothetical protein